jgi:hypothetical protein
MMMVIQMRTAKRACKGKRKRVLRNYCCSGEMMVPSFPSGGSQTSRRLFAVVGHQAVMKLKKIVILQSRMKR